MKIKAGKVQQLIAEELSRATSRRSRTAAGSPMFARSVDLCEVMTFARGYAALTEAEREDVDALLDGNFDEVEAAPVKMKNTVGGVHPELDEAIDEFARWSKTGR